jgi:hypothetical protein
VASGVGLGKLAAEEMKQVGLAATKGVFAAASAAWSVINKYGPWLLFFGIYTLIFEDPFFTTPALLLLLWIWAIGAHWLKFKWLRPLNVLEWLALIVTSAIYGVAFVLIIIMLAFVVYAADTGCALEAVQMMGTDIIF